MMLSSVLMAMMALSVSYGAQIEWTADDYPNPQTNPLDCGRNDVSYVCDPNSIITKKQADFLDHILLNFQNDTQCPCSAWSCKTNNKGYQIAVALVRKLARPDYFENTEAGRKSLAGRFAFDLLRKKWTWGICDEMTVIVYSKDDKILVTLPGKTARMKLTEEAVYAIEYELSRFFQDDDRVGQGLGFMILNYRHVLDGHHYFPIIYSHVPSGANIIQVSILVSFLTTLLLKLFC